MYRCVEQKARDLCPHHVGHYLGMDVHDSSDVSRSTKLEPGMVITIEPGRMLSALTPCVCLCVCVFFGEGGGLWWSHMESNACVHNQI